MCCHTGMPCLRHRTGHPTPSQYTDTGPTCRCAVHCMAVGTGGGGGGGNCPPNILPTKKIKSLNIMRYKSLYSNKAKLGSYLSGYWKSQIKSCTMCILLKCKCDTKKFFWPPLSETRSYSLILTWTITLEYATTHFNVLG